MEGGGLTSKGVFVTSQAQWKYLHGKDEEMWFCDAFCDSLLFYFLCKDGHLKKCLCNFKGCRVNGYIQTKVVFIFLNPVIADYKDISPVTSRLLKLFELFLRERHFEFLKRYFLKIGMESVPCQKSFWRITLK